MSKQRRNFSAKFKSDLVIELLKGEKNLKTLATEHNLQPNLLRNWKKEFLSNASVVFDFDLFKWLFWHECGTKNALTPSHLPA